MGGVRLYWRCRACIAFQTASVRLADAGCMIRSQMSALSVPVLIGSKSPTAFLAIAHVTAHEQYRQFFARVLGSARDGKTCL